MNKEVLKFALAKIDSMSDEEIEQGLIAAGFQVVRRTATDHPAPASTGREPIYQVQFTGQGSAWHDASEAAYHTFVEKRRRIVYAQPAPATGGEPSKEILRAMVAAANHEDEYVSFDGARAIYKVLFPDTGGRTGRRGRAPDEDES